MYHHTAGSNTEDSEHGADRRGEERPDWMVDKQRRLEAIRAAKAALEAEAADPPDPEDESGPGASSGMRWQGRALRSEDGGPPDRAQRTFTDPDSRIPPTRDGFVQGYNGQIAVDAGHQVIVAHRLVTTSADHRALVPLVDSIHSHLGRKPREVSGDAGFATEANLAALKERRIKAYLPPHHGRKPREVSGDAGFPTEANLAALKEPGIKPSLPPGRPRHGEAHAAGRR